MADRLRIFIDSNIWFSAFYKKGQAFNLLEKCREKRFEVVISQLVLEEIIRNIKKKLPRKLENVRSFLITYPLVIVKNPSKKDLTKVEGLAHKKDRPILAAALNYKCRFLITGNLKDFKEKSIKEKFNLEVISLGKASSTTEVQP